MRGLNAPSCAVFSPLLFDPVAGTGFILLLGDDDEENSVEAASVPDRSSGVATVAMEQEARTGVFFWEGKEGRSREEK